MDHWSFPDLILQPDSFLLIFASGRSDYSQDHLHTDFKLQQMEDPVYLLNPSGSVIDQIAVECVPADLSLGRLGNAMETFRVLDPTPGYSNEGAVVHTINFKKDSLQVNYPAGFYDRPIVIQLQNDHPENLIKYSLDSDDPDDNSETFQGQLYLRDISDNKNRFADRSDDGFKPGDLISKASVLRAMVYSEGCPASNEIANTYFIDESGWSNYHVPVVSIITDEGNLFDEEEGIYVYGNHANYSQHGSEWERRIHLEVFDTSQVQIINQDAGIRIHGRGSRKASQKSLRLLAKEKYGKESFDYPFFNQKPQLNSFKTLLLRSTRGWSGTLIKDELCQALVQDMNMDYTATQTSILFINGEYWGIYSLRERHDKYYVENNFQLTNAELNIIGHDKENLLIEEGSGVRYQQLISDLSAKDASEENFYDFVRNNIDIDNLLDYYSAQLYLANTDFPNNNYEIWSLQDDTSKWRFFFFDLDAAMVRINFDHLSEYNNNFENYQRYQNYSTFLFRALLQNKFIRDLFFTRFNQHLATTFSTSRVLKLIDEFEQNYQPLVNEQIYRWEVPSDYTKWQHNIEMLRLFAIERPVYLNQQLQENFGNPFVIYPNPCQEIFNIKFLSHDDASLEIVDMNGRLVFQSQKERTESLQIKLNLSPGIYLLKIETGYKTYSDKLIVQ
jgi:hypothetical protein